MSVTPQAAVQKTYIKVRNFHLDAFRHVNNTRYLEFLEDARWAYFDGLEKLWYQHFSKSIAFVVVNITIDYLYPATMGQVLEVQTAVSKVGNSSAVFDQRIVLEGTDKTVVHAKVTLVLMDSKEQKSVTLPDAIREVLLPHKSA